MAKYKYIWGNPECPAAVRAKIEEIVGCKLSETYINDLQNPSSLFLMEEGKVVIYNRSFDWLDGGIKIDIVLSSPICEEVVPDTARFKVGDWVIWNGGYYAVTAVEPRSAKNGDAKGAYQLLLGNTQWVGENLVTPAMGRWVMDNDTKLRRFG